MKRSTVTTHKITKFWFLNCIVQFHITFDKLFENNAKDIYHCKYMCRVRYIVKVYNIHNVLLAIIIFVVLLIFLLIMSKQRTRFTPLTLSRTHWYCAASSTVGFPRGNFHRKCGNIYSGKFELIFILLLIFLSCVVNFIIFRIKNCIHSKNLEFKIFPSFTLGIPSALSAVLFSSYISFLDQRQKSEINQAG